MAWDLSYIGKKVEEEAVRLVKDIATDMATNLVYKSHEDTSRFLSNTNASMDEPNESGDENKVLGRSGSIAQCTRAINAMPNDKLHSVYITNHVKYGVYLEAGYSAQSPNGVFYPVFVAVSSMYGRPRVIS